MRKRLIFGTLTLLLALMAGSSLFAEGKATLVDINTADEKELTTLPRIGPSVARRIIEYRRENGGFEKIEELMNIRGIGQKTFDRLKDRVTVGEKEPAEGDPSKGKKESKGKT